MKILSFDQSSTKSGFSIFENEQYVDSGLIDKHKITDQDKRVAEMGLAIYKKIKEIEPSLVIIEGVQQQSNAATMILLARLQGMVLGYCAAHKIRVEILGPSQWRSVLKFKQGAKVKREVLKQQAMDYVNKNFEIEGCTEDQSEAVCIGVAATKLFEGEWGE